MTAGAIFRNCSESSGLLDIYGALAAAAAARTDSNVSGVILLSNGWTATDALPRSQLFALETAVSFLFTLLFFICCGTSPFFPIDEAK